MARGTRGTSNTRGGLKPTTYGSQLYGALGSDGRYAISDGSRLTRSQFAEVFGKENADKIWGTTAQKTPSNRSISLSGSITRQTRQRSKSPSNYFNKYRGTGMTDSDDALIGRGNAKS